MDWTASTEYRPQLIWFLSESPWFHFQQLLSCGTNKVGGGPIQMLDQNRPIYINIGEHSTRHAQLSSEFCVSFSHSNSISQHLTLSPTLDHLWGAIIARLICSDYESKLEGLCLLSVDKSYKFKEWTQSWTVNCQASYRLVQACLSLGTQSGPIYVRNNVKFKNSDIQYRSSMKKHPWYSMRPL